MSKLTILVDFDGTLHQYKTPWTNPWTISDPPIKDAIDFLEACKNAGIKVVLFTTRVNKLSVKEKLKTNKALRAWLKKYKYSLADSITITDKKLQSHLILDDRAFNFSGKYPSIDQITNFKPWNRKSMLANKASPKPKTKEEYHQEKEVYHRKKAEEKPGTANSEYHLKQANYHKNHLKKAEDTGMYTWTLTCDKCGSNEQVETHVPYWGARVQSCSSCGGPRTVGKNPAFVTQI